MTFRAIDFDDPDRWHLPADPWSTHASWVERLDSVAEVIDAFTGAMARRGLADHEVRNAAIICAAVLEPVGDGTFRLRSFPDEWPPIHP